jgi:hypothetical protein
MENTTNKEQEKISEKNDELYAADGTDLTLIRWMLSMSPAERLRNLQSQINSIARIRRGLRRV